MTEKGPVDPLGKEGVRFSDPIEYGPRYGMSREEWIKEMTKRGYKIGEKGEPGEPGIPGPGWRPNIIYHQPLGRFC